MKVFRWRSAQASALAMGLALAGCGGGSGGGSVASTPTPTPSSAPTPSPSPSPTPSPTPSPSPTPTPAAYTKTVEMTGDRTFQTAGVRFVSNNSVAATSGAAQPFGSGVSVAYTAATDSYKLTAFDGSTVSFDPSNVSTSALPNTQEWSKVNGTIRDTLLLTVPVVNGVGLSYTIIGQWVHYDSATNQALNRIGLGGAPTLASDMPRSGTATYAAVLSGDVSHNGVSFGGLGNGNSVTFSADFANNSVATALTLSEGGARPPLGTFNGTGTISSTGPGFSGTFTGTGITGAFSGAFFGPKALEMAYGWYIAGPDFNGGGTVAGVKQ